MPEVLMPRLSDSMEEGTIVRWLKQDGDRVTQGEALAEVETDKATVTFDADADGTLQILVTEGKTVPLGTPIARIGEVAHAAGNGAERIKASPLARRMARESGIDLEGLTGSGPGGRIVKADLDRAPAPPSAPVPAAPVIRGNKGAVTVEQLSRTQVQIAQRMAESRATIPDFTLGAEIDMASAVALREQLRRARSTDVVPSYNDMVLKACAIALREHPRDTAAY